MIFEHRGESGLIKGEVSLSVFVATKYHDIEQRKKMRNKKRIKDLMILSQRAFIGLNWKIVVAQCQTNK